MRVIRTWFDGWRHLSHASSPLLRERGRRMRQYVKDALPALYPAAFFGPNRCQRRSARVLIRKIRAELEAPRSSRLSGWATLPLAAWTRLAVRLDIGQQPKLHRVEYPHRMVYTRSRLDGSQ